MPSPSKTPGHRALDALSEGYVVILDGHRFMMAEDGQIVTEGTNQTTGETVWLNAIGDYEGFIAKINDLSFDEQFLISSSIALQRHHNSK